MIRLQQEHQTTLHFDTKFVNIATGIETGTVL